MWLTLAAAAFFAIVFLVIVLRADRSVANGALTVMTLLAVAVAAAATVRGLGTEEGGAAAARASLGGTPSMPALSCIDDLAGDNVEAACEKVLFGSPDHVAAAVSYAATRLDRLTALGDVSAASRMMTPELQALRRAVERDRYGLIAHVLVARDGCTAAMCPAYRSLTDQRQMASNIEGRVYEGLVTRYMPMWSGALATAIDSGSAPSANPAAAAAAVTGELPSGKPTNAEFPSSASIPPVSIMTSEPAAPAPSAPSATPAPTPRPAAAPKAKAPPKAAPKAAASSHSPAAPRRPANPAPPPPVQLAPAPSSGDR